MPSFPRDIAERRRRHAETLLHAGHSDTDVQRITGIDRSTAARYRKQLGLPGYQTRADSPTCRYGHPFPENLAYLPNGWLYCRECSRQRYQSRTEPDWVAIERAAAGDPPDRLTPRERAAAVTQLVNRQLPARLIAERVRCSKRTVHRVRARRREAA